jgi:hypothetical protein
LCPCAANCFFPLHDGRVRRKPGGIVGVVRRGAGDVLGLRCFQAGSVSRTDCRLSCGTGVGGLLAHSGGYDGNQCTCEYNAGSSHLCLLKCVNGPRLSACRGSAANNSPAGKQAESWKRHNFPSL